MSAYAIMSADGKLRMISGSITALASRPGARQFVKFCIVGASSTIIDFTLFNLLVENGVLVGFGLLRRGLSPALALTCSFLVAVSNGFLWNSRWTFRAARGDARKQYPKFVATNVVGWLLNLSITTLALMIAAHLHLTHVHHTPAETMRIVAFGTRAGEIGFTALALNAAKAAATCVVLAWNFTASKLWTFKR
jgi:putative flippase GtrA